MSIRRLSTKLGSANKGLICKKCGSTNIGKDPEVHQAVVQRLSKKTGKPIGKPTTYYMFQCLVCGEGFYLEKYKVKSKS